MSVPAGTIATCCSPMSPPPRLRPPRTGVGPAALRNPPPAAAEPTLSVSEVDAALERMADVSGPGSQGVRAAEVRALFARATAEEQRLLRGLLTGELRQGALEGLMVEAVAAASAVPATAVRRATMLAGDLQRAAAAALTGGEVAVDWKLDGVRVQVHRDGTDVAVFTRSLEEITSRVPEVVETALALKVGAAVLDGEAIALRPDGRPRPFQETGGRGRGPPRRLRRSTGGAAVDVRLRSASPRRRGRPRPLGARAVCCPRVCHTGRAAGAPDRDP